MFNSQNVPLDKVNATVLEWQIEAARPSFKGHINNLNRKHAS